TIGTPDRQTVSSLGRNQPRDDAARVGRNDVALELRLHLAVRVQDVQQDCFHPLVSDRAQISTGLKSHTFELMTSRAFLLEDGLTADRIAFELERLLICGN